MLRPSCPKRTAERLSARIDRSGGPLACHPWTGKFGQHGNPAIYMTRNGRKGGGSARRVLWELTHGVLEKTRRIRVTCGNLSCMNLAHMTLEPVKDPVPRFWKNVNKLPGDGCWEWMATRSVRTSRNNRRGEGYGNFMVTALSRVAAHRFSWELHSGRPIPDGMIILHLCDNPPCVRPDHLKLGTYMDNHADMVSKGRAAHQRDPEAVARSLAKGRAVAHGHAGRPLLLSVEQHVDIKLKRASGYSVREIAEDYAMKESTIWKASKRALPTGGAER